MEWKTLCVEALRQLEKVLVMVLHSLVLDRQLVMVLEMVLAMEGIRKFPHVAQWLFLLPLEMGLVMALAMVLEMQLEMVFYMQLEMVLVMEGFR